MSALVDPYDLVVLDLDGVVILGDRAVAGAPEALRRLRSTGKTVRFATNNASRGAGEVAQLLAGVGIPAAPEEVLTSASAAADVLAARFPAGSPVLVVGAPALQAAVTAAGLTPVTRADDKPVAVVQGYGPGIGWVHLAEACVAIRDSALWIVTNTDRTLPTPRGELPGNGALVAALATALDRLPDVIVGKPEPGLFLAAAKQVGAARTLIVGDRLDTDIAGARRAGMDSLLVLTGVTTREMLSRAAPRQRPAFVAADLSGLFSSGVNEMVERKVSEPVQDALKAYLELALGLTEASKKKAEKTVKRLAKELTGKGVATAGQLQSMAEDLIATSAANREAVARLVRVEMDRALSRVGLATADEVSTLVARIDAVERQIRDEAAGAGSAAGAKPAAAELVDNQPAGRRPTVVKKAPVVKKATSAARSITRGQASAKRAEQAPAKKAAPAAPTVAASKTVAKKVPAKKVPAKKAVKKATP